MTTPSINGFIVLDKPKSITSTKALSIVKRSLKVKKAGHGGTLDPMATGILPLAFGEATKALTYVTGSEKVYRFTVQWGAQTDTDDAEGQVIETCDYRPSEKEILEILPNYIGKIDQLPPQYSALKVKGQRAYELARAGKKADIKPRQVEIKKFELIRADKNEAEFEVTCGTGTYIRALGRDLGQQLRCLGHITALRRKKVGNFDEKSAFPLDFFEKKGHIANPATFLLEIEEALDDIPAISVSAAEAARLKNGQPLSLVTKTDQARLPAENKGDNKTELQGRTFFIKSENNLPIAFCEYRQAVLKPIRVFNF